MEEQFLWALMTLAGYVFGSIPFGIVVSKAMGLPDPRTIGSKNVGFTNVLRVSGTKAGVLTLLGDMGKGVATALGSVLGLSPSMGVLLLVIWIGTVAIWRYSSGGALAAFGMFPVVAIVNEQRQEFLLFSVVVSALIWYQHKDNIVRLWKGTESKIGQSKT